MQRCKELEHYIEEYRTNRLNRKRAEITDTWDTLLPSLTDALDTLIREQCRLQREGSQEKVKYILFHPLLTSVCTGSLETAAGMGNYMLFLDKHMSYTYWKPESIYQDMDKDMEEVRRLLGLDIILRSVETCHGKHRRKNKRQCAFSGRGSTGFVRRIYGEAGYCGQHFRRETLRIKRGAGEWAEIKVLSIWEMRLTEAGKPHI